MDTIVLYCEVGYAKPDPRICTATRQRIGPDAADVLFIDDTPGHVATAAQMFGHVHRNAEDTITRIRDFLRPPNRGWPGLRGPMAP